MSIEDPELDRLEQLRDAGYDDPEDAEYLEELPLDADPRDVADQHRSVPLDDDLEG